MWPRRNGAYREQFRRSAVPQALCDSRGRLVDVNPAFERLVDQPRERLTGRTTRELSHRTDPGDADAALARLLAGATPAAQAERVFAGADGRPVPTLASATAVDGGATVAYQDLSVLRSVDKRRRQQEDFFLAISQRASELAVVLDPEGVVLFASPALTSVLGHRVEDVASEPALGLVHPADRRRALAAFSRAVGERATGPQTLRVRHADGTWRWLDATITDLLDTAVGGLVANLRDVTDRVRAEEALRASERRYRAIADHADEGLWVTAPDGRTVYLNRRLEEILGLDADELLGRPVREVLGLEAGADDRGEVGYVHPDGGPRVLRVTSTPLDDAGGLVDGALAMVSDVTEARRLEHELREAALHDALTGLANRALLIDRLEHALTRETTATAVLFVDLDHFRGINDERGHAVGDEVLVEAAHRLRSAVRPSDTVGRLGRDEFVVVSEDTDQEAGQAIGARLLEALRPPYATTAGTLHVGASIGVAVTPVAAGRSLLRHAETATYAAKAAGRGRVQLFDAAVAELARQRFELGVELARAIAADQLHLNYQPVVDLGTGDVVGVEALARWDHPRLGAVPPDRFVAVAEAEGLTAKLDGWAVRRALAEAAELRRAGALPPTAYVAVNLSARTLGDPDLETWVGAAAEAAGVEPEAVVLEVTESATMADPRTAVRVLEGLCARGFRIAVDDFGTGHSSLSYLRRLPVAMLKVDRSFVAELATEPGARAITASVVDLARILGLTVVAEGVETAEQVEVLRRLGATSGQGWLWSRAVPPGEATATGALTCRYDVGS